MAATPEAICNQALALLGLRAMDGTVAAPTSTVDRDVACAALYEQTRDATVDAAEWNEAIVRDTLYSYATPATTMTPGAGALTAGTTGVVFTAGAATFTSLAVDAGKTIRPVSGPGVATITGFTSTTVVTATITVAFTSLAALAADAWRLYNPTPDWDSDFLYTFTLPTDWLRGYGPAYQAREGIHWRREGAVIVSSEPTLNLLYVKRITDVTTMTPRLTECIVYHLAAKLCEAGLGNAAKGDRLWNLYTAKLRQAKGLDLQEGTRQRYQPSSYVDVRRGGGWWPR